MRKRYESIGDAQRACDETNSKQIWKMSGRADAEYLQHTEYSEPYYYDDDRTDWWEEKVTIICRCESNHLKCNKLDCSSCNFALLYGLRELLSK